MRRHRNCLASCHALPRTCGGGSAQGRNCALARSSLPTTQGSQGIVAPRASRSPTKSNCPPRPRALNHRGTATRVTRAMRRQGATAVGIGAVAVTLTALSLSHLAHGIELVTHADGWESWAMAIGI